MAAKQDYGGDGSPNGRWVTINGAHVFIKHGQSAEDALKERDESKQNANYSDSSKADKQREAVKKYSDTPEKDIAEIGLGSSAYRDALSKVKSFTADEDGTFDYSTGTPVSFDGGYQVSFQQSTIDYTPEEYDRLVNDTVKQTGSKPYIGNFGEPEISFHCEDLKTATKVMKQYNQHSIWDWKKGTTKENPKYEESNNPIKRKQV